MHIADGMVPAQFCIGGYAATGLLSWVCLRQINRVSDPAQGIPKAALLTATFFVASLLHIPIPPASVHLVLNGLLGVVLGYYAFLAVLIGLFFQAIMFGHGGLSTLGINAIIMGLPALLAALIFRSGLWLLRSFPNRWAMGISAFFGGAIALILAVSLFAVLAVLGLPGGVDAIAERTAIFALVTAHLPLAVIEGAFTTLVVLFLDQVKPDLLKHTW
ncbi:MAG TPA: cobalt transporter CbiM [Leptolyngbyaceae cyanobacterium M33_DOE_097]|uniref:Cobalt transporter CbiM n=1 Tax=Oscillatoriales cyanobacterium SpSt-418 TaxID=2282169 RepID=A0A7C3PQB6_9CYAN|nr:cobalt transporter CbiM [Leptolyngbyaceae cyanobacterium M33_DOE_097]